MLYIKNKQPLGYAAPKQWQGVNSRQSFQRTSILVYSNILLLWRDVFIYLFSVALLLLEYLLHSSIKKKGLWLCMQKWHDSHTALELKYLDLLQQQKNLFCSTDLKYVKKTRTVSQSMLTRLNSLYRYFITPRTQNDLQSLKSLLPWQHKFHRCCLANLLKTSKVLSWLPEGWCPKQLWREAGNVFTYKKWAPVNIYTSWNNFSI